MQHGTRRDIAESLSRRGFVRVRLGRRLAGELSELSSHAETLFRSGDDGDAAGPSSSSSSSLIRRHQRVVATLAGGSELHGYAEPSPAKQLFRFFPGDGERPSFPLPRDLVDSCFCGLKRRLELCLSVALRGARGPDSDGACLDFAGLCSAALVSTTSPTTAAATATSSSSSSSSCAADAGCPLDIFRYRNTEGASEGATAVPAEVNCSAHVDRGLMHIIASSSAGLEVLNRSTGAFQLVDDYDDDDEEEEEEEEEEEDHGDCVRVVHESGDVHKGGAKKRKRRGSPDRGARRFRTAIVLTNAALEDLTRKMASEQQQEGEEGGEEPKAAGPLVLPACVHQVVGVVGRPRVSISLELRLPASPIPSMIPSGIMPPG